MFFSYTRCEVGGVELLRRDPATDRWSRTELAKNGKDVLQDRPGLAVEGNKVFYAWAEFDSCQGNAVESPLKVGLSAGPRPAAPKRVLDVPGTRYSQGAAPAGDGRGGFWVAWEEYPDAVANSGSIKLAHWRPAQGWNEPKTISPPGFRDLPEPLPGFDVDTSSVPAIAVSKGIPHVVWASADSGRGRIYLWTPAGVRAIRDTGGDQLLPAIAPQSGGASSCRSARPTRTGQMDRLLWRSGRARVISSAPSFPRAERFFDGRFRLGLRARLLSRPDDRGLAGCPARPRGRDRFGHVRLGVGTLRRVVLPLMRPEMHADRWPEPGSARLDDPGGVSP